MRTFLVWILFSVFLSICNTKVVAGDVLIPMTRTNIQDVKLLGAAYTQHCSYYWCHIFQFSADSSRFLLTNFDKVEVWNSLTLAEEAEWDAEGLEYAALNYDGSIVVTFDGTIDQFVGMGKEGTLHLRNVITGNEQSFKLDRGVVRVSPNGQLVAHSRPDGIIIRDIDTGQVIAEQQYDAMTGIPLAFNNQGTFLVYELRNMFTLKDETGDNKRFLRKELWLWSAIDGFRQLEALTEEPVTVEVYNYFALASAAFSNDNSLIVVARDDLRAWDVQTGHLTATIPYWDRVNRETFIFNPEHKQVLVRNRRTGELVFEVWDALTDKLLYVWNDDLTRHIQIFPGPNKIYLSISEEGHVMVWNAAVGEIEATPTDFPDFISDFAFNNDGTVLAASGGHSDSHSPNNQIRLYDVDTMEILLQLPEHVSHVSNLVMSPDDTTLVVISENFLLWYGIPTAIRAVSSSIVGQANDEYINLRSAPSFDADIIGRVAGDILITGRDASGQFVYLESHGGWVHSGLPYIDTYGVSLEQLPILSS